MKLNMNTVERIICYIIYLLIVVFTLKGGLYEIIYGSRGGSMKIDKLPQVMSVESASVGSEDYKFGNETNLQVWR